MGNFGVLFVADRTAHYPSSYGKKSALKKCKGGVENEGTTISRFLSLDLLEIWKTKCHHFPQMARWLRVLGFDLVKSKS